METTKHFVTSVFVVNENKIALHDHKKLDLILPPGGHIDRDELPHTAAKREVKEETGLDVTLVPSGQTVSDSNWSKPIPQPNNFLLDDITLTNGEPTHQHINHVFYAHTDEADIQPEGDDEVTADDWYWVTKEELETQTAPVEIDPLTREIGIKAIEFVNTQQ